MSSPLPPDQWPHQPDEGFFGIDPDEDTGPLQVVSQPEGNASYAETQQAGYPPENQHFPPIADYSQQVAGSETLAAQWPPSYHPPIGREAVADRYAVPLTVDPRAVPLKRTGFRYGPLLGGVAAVLIAGVAVWLLWPSSDASESGTAGTKPSVSGATEAPNPDQKTLLGLLPKGYSSTACVQAEIPTSALASVDCTANSDFGGPPTATYTLYANAATLRSAFDAVVGDAGPVVCPGRIQSPGPWRRNATPQEVAGTLVCGARGGIATVAWTTDSELLLSSVEGAQSGPSLDQLYAWWSNHS